MSTQADHADAALAYLRGVVLGTERPDATRIAAARAILPSADADDPDALAYLAATVAGDEPPNRDRVAAARVLAPGVAAEPPATEQQTAYFSAGTGAFLGITPSECPGPIALIDYCYDGEGDPAFAEDDPLLQLQPDAAPHGLTLDGADDSLQGTERTGKTMQEKRNEQVPALRATVQGHTMQEASSLIVPLD